MSECVNQGAAERALLLLLIQQRTREITECFQKLTEEYVYRKSQTTYLIYARNRLAHLLGLELPVLARWVRFKFVWCARDDPFYRAYSVHVCVGDIIAHTVDGTVKDSYVQNSWPWT